MSDPRFKEALRRKLKKRGRLPRPPRIIHPDGVERQYRNALRAVVAGAKKIVDDYVLPRIQSAIRQREFSLPTGIKKDEWSDDIADAFDSARDQFTRVYTDEEIRALARRYGISVAEFNLMQIEKNFRRVVGVDVFASEPWLASEIQAFTAQNIALIDSIPENYFKDLETGIFQRMSTGSRFEAIGQFIEDRTGIAERKAQLVARDQVSKLNGQLTGLRQTAAGIPKYVWRTSGDERVRDSHRVKEGKIYEWANPPADTGHPGEDINCRCFAEPYFESAVEGEAEFNTGVKAE